MAVRLHRPRGVGTSWTAWVAGITLVVLHLDFWREQRVVLYFDWLPEELLYRIVWLLAAWAYLAWFCASVWRDEE